MDEKFLFYSQPDEAVRSYLYLSQRNRVSAWQVDDQVFGYRKQSLSLASRLDAEQMSRRLPKCLQEASRPGLSGPMFEGHRFRIDIGDGRCRRGCDRLRQIIFPRIPDSFEYRCHILVQTWPMWCHRLSFRANKFLSLHSVRAGIAREKTRDEFHHPVSSQHPALNL